MRQDVAKRISSALRMLADAFDLEAEDAAGSADPPRNDTGKSSLRAETPLMTVNESALYMRISRSMVRKLIRRRELSVVSVGRRVLIERGSILSYVASRSMYATDDKRVAVGPIKRSRSAQRRRLKYGTMGVAAMRLRQLERELKKKGNSR